MSAEARLVDLDSLRELREGGECRSEVTVDEDQLRAPDVRGELSNAPRRERRWPMPGSAGLNGTFRMAPTGVYFQASSLVLGKPRSETH